MARVLERAIRRAKVPVAYSQGFSPRPKLHFGLALSTGYESDAEYLDLDLDTGRVGIAEPEAIAEALQLCVPNGITVSSAAIVDAAGRSLMDSVTSAEWTAFVGENPQRITEKCAEMLNAQTIEIEIERKGKQRREDLRPLLLSLDVLSPETRPLSADSSDSGPSVPTTADHLNTERVGLHFELATKPRTVRPAELLAVLGVTEPLLVRRTNQWIERDGIQLGPLREPADPSPHAEVCAS